MLIKSKGMYWMTNTRYLTVKGLTKYLKRKFDADPYLRNVYVKGEISNFKQHSSGHMYFTLKDEQARISAVMFFSENKALRFKPENGMQVLVRGNITIYEASGQYQIYVKEMQPDGIGELFLAYEQLKEKLSKEGLFDQSKKKQIPHYPDVIGVITSPTGAAIRDIITTIKRRYPFGKIIVFPASVQGKHAGTSIAQAIQKANENNEPDLLIVGRGGGSIEELWAFNEEVVTRAINESTIPIISAVGHETDFTIADFVADLRAPTPTAAAEIAVPHIDEILEKLLTSKARLAQSMRMIIKKEKQRLKAIQQSYIFRYPQRIYEQKMEQTDKLTERLQRQQQYLYENAERSLTEMEKRLKRSHPNSLLKLSMERSERLKKNLNQQMAIFITGKKHEFGKLITTLNTLNPLRMLERGYSVAYTENNEILTKVEQVNQGEKVTLQVTDGQLSCIVNEIDKEERGKNE